jgi:shikimate dehydrogenase
VSVQEISAHTRVCAVIGDPVGHSLSPQIHNAAFKARALDFVYVAYHVARGDAARAVSGVRALGIRGLSVTIPHKLDVIAQLDAIDETARQMGSVNTIVNDHGVLTGYSTDGPGALRALAAEGVDPAGRRVLLLGSGGAARAIAFTLAGLSPRPRLRILGVEAQELAQLGRDVREKAGVTLDADALTPESLAAAMREAEIVVHATPIGMTPKTDASLVPSALITSRHAVLDVVYTPRVTKLLTDAKAAGAKVVPGIGMFVGQAAVQFELWTGVAAPVDVMTEAVLSALRDVVR